MCQLTLHGTKVTTPGDPPTPHRFTTDKLALSNTQGKLQHIKGLIYPTGPAVNHPAADMLLRFGKDGCKARCGPNWSAHQIQAAIDYAAHPTAQVPEAATALRAETLEKVTQGYARLVKWEDLKLDPPDNLKVSPIAAIPHKTRHYRAILDLSFVLRELRDEVESVNTTTDVCSHPAALDQLGQVLPRLFRMLAWAPQAQGPLMFQKLDIKDGYWRGVVEQGGEWNFCYVLPKLQDSEPTQLVVPLCLQMGWAESPGYFCTASETARDISEHLCALPIGTLPSHDLEDTTMEDYAHEMQKHRGPTTSAEDPRGPQWLPPHPLLPAKDFCHLLEVYVDDFIQAAQTTNPTRLLDLSSALLHAIHSVFPPPKWTKHTGADPIHPKKTRLEGTWEFSKEILGWVVDGIHRHVSLPSKKVAQLHNLLQALVPARGAKTKEMETLRGKLQHATMGYPAAKPLMGPFHKTIRHRQRWTTITPEMRSAAKEFRYVLKHAANHPTLARHIVPTMPAYCGPHDASGLGAGGVWFSGTKLIQPTVWRIEWPDNIRANLVSFKNPHGNITNSDLELAGAILQLLVLEAIVTLEDCNTMLASDNTPTVGWIRKLSCSSSNVATELLKVLGARMMHGKFPPPQIHHIAGVDNKLADYASRRFSSKGPDGSTRPYSDFQFLTDFTHTFPTQNTSWRLFQLNSAIVSRIIAILLTGPSTMASWRRLTAKGNAFGTIGSPTATSLTWTPASPTTPLPNRRPPWECSPTELGKVHFPAALLSECKQFKSRSELSARPLNWTDSQIHATNPTKRVTTDSSHGSLRATAAQTPHPNKNSPSP